MRKKFVMESIGLSMIWCKVVIKYVCLKWESLVNIITGFKIF